MSKTRRPLFSVNLEDPTSNKIYSILVTADEAKQLETDTNFAAKKLEEAKNFERTANINGEMESTEALDSECDIDQSTAVDCAVDETDDLAFKWPHDAVIILLEKYRLWENDFKSGRTSQKKLWCKISYELCKKGHNVSGPQCHSKFVGLKRTYKKIKQRNDILGTASKTWPYFQMMDDLLKVNLYMSSLATVTSTKRKMRSRSESTSDLSTTSGVNHSPLIKKRRRIIGNVKITESINEWRKVIEEKREQRFRKRMRQKEQQFQQMMADNKLRHKENMELKQKALDILKALLQQNN